MQTRIDQYSMASQRRMALGQAITVPMRCGALTSHLAGTGITSQGCSILLWMKCTALIPGIKAQRQARKPLVYPCTQESHAIYTNTQHWNINIDVNPSKTNRASELEL